MLIALLHSASPRAGITTEWLAERLELRNALIALDGDCVGAKWHEIARVIYGAARVDAERGDSESTMRHKIKRDLARGRRLVSGGYRDMLRTAKGRALGADS